MTLSQLFAVVWVSMGVGAYFLFIRSRNAALKRRYYAPYILISSTLFLAYVAATAEHWRVVAFALPFIVLITYINLRSIKFCGACGRTYNNGWFGKVRRCPNCDAEID